MRDRMRVRPLRGLRVYDPRTQIPLPAGGAQVPRTSYWLRRLKDGDVELVEPRRRRPTKEE